jgi:hypothetical protein
MPYQSSCYLEKEFGYLTAEARRTPRESKEEIFFKKPS